MTFLEFACQLRDNLGRDFISVNPQRNPVARELSKLSTPQLAHVLVQYSVFSRRIVSFLTDAFYVMRFEGWESVFKEILQNISEELAEDDETGSRVPHYILLRRGFQAALNVDLASFTVESATQAFIDRIHQIMASRDPAYVAGSVYAIESTARPELEMTFDWTKELFRRHEQEVPSDVLFFFTSHIEAIEILHESRLREACARYIDGREARSAFECGFRAVVESMDAWWMALHGEARAIAPAAAAATPRSRP